MKILVIDNYDSFTYNLVQLVGNFQHQLVVKRNDEIESDAPAPTFTRVDFEDI